ncbi:protein RDR1 [Paramyrothecium foliicola]|nr:protein RDR1 [Paramyrothecium foliicola]
MKYKSNRRQESYKPVIADLPAIPDLSVNPVIADSAGLTARQPLVHWSEAQLGNVLDWIWDQVLNMPTPVSLKRKRAKAACMPCRELKRKCDGALPCAACVRFEYECHYQDTSGRRKKPDHGHDQASPEVRASLRNTTGSPSVRSGAGAQVSGNHHSLLPQEANSGAAFVRNLALDIDPINAPRMHLFAWNVFLGARDAISPPKARLLAEIISRADLEQLATHYFDKVHPCYGFIDRHVFERHVQSRWSNPTSPDPLVDAVLCGVAALGCVFSQVHPPAVELELAALAKSILEPLLSDAPSITSITAWLLRVVYLRIAGTPHAAWMASCTLMHMMEAAGMHSEPEKEAVLGTPSGDVHPETRRRLFGIAQHLNIWISFDVGRSKATHLKTDILLATPREGDYTIELLELLPHVAILDPNVEVDGPELEKTLTIVLDRVHAEPPSSMARSNLVLCICRRLRSLNYALSGVLLARLLEVMEKSVAAARAMVVNGTPWHQTVNVPFQILCILLAIDTPTSTHQLKDVMACLSEVAAKWNTNATQEALKTASLLIYMYKKQKERSIAGLDDILRSYPVTQTTGNPISSVAQVEDMMWLDNLMSELPTFQDLLNGAVMDIPSEI